MRNREGFTLIELLIVVVIIGILAAIALPKFGATRENAYVSAMKSDLRNLQTAEEMYYMDPAGGNYNYKANASITAAAPDTDMDFQPSQGVTVAVTLDAANNGYSATADHDGTSQQCTVVVGDNPQPITCATP